MKPPPHLAIKGDPHGTMFTVGLAALDDDECILNRDLECQRRDAPHHHDMSELRDWSGVLIRHAFGPCIHRHAVPVESCVTGETLARLCLNCDEQLP